MTEEKKPKPEHKHDWRWEPRGMPNFNVKLNGNQKWYRCVRPGCTQMILRQAIKRKSKFRSKKR